MTEPLTPEERDRLAEVCEKAVGGGWDDSSRLAFAARTAIPRLLAENETLREDQAKLDSLMADMRREAEALRKQLADMVDGNAELLTQLAESTANEQRLIGKLHAVSVERAKNYDFAMQLQKQLAEAEADRAHACAEKDAALIRLGEKMIAGLDAKAEGKREGMEEAAKACPWAADQHRLRRLAQQQEPSHDQD